MVLIYISLMMSNVELLLTYLLPMSICMSSLEKCLFNSSDHLKLDFFFCYWVLGVLCILWILTPYHINDSKIFKWFQFHSSLFHLLMFFLLDAFKFNVSHLFISLLFLCFLVSSQKKKKIIAKIECQGAHPAMFSCRSFIVSVLWFKVDFFV